jgi:hypothetical protein
VTKGEHVKQRFERDGDVHIARNPKPYGLKAYCGVVMNRPIELTEAVPTCQVCIDAQAPGSED